MHDAPVERAQQHMNHPTDQCDVAGCTAPAAGFYLQASDANSVEFEVCDNHFAELQAGKRPSVVAARLDLANLDGHPALLLE